MQVSSLYQIPSAFLGSAVVYCIKAPLTYPVTLQHYAFACGNLFIFPLEPLANLHCSNIFTSLQTMFYLVSNSLDVIASDVCSLSHVAHSCIQLLTSRLMLTRCSPPSSLSAPGLGVPPPTPINSLAPPRNPYPPWNLNASSIYIGLDNVPAPKDETLQY